jgi:putative toxin-antitoxin system antitoxin component (TIGR02293 family)
MPKTLKGSESRQLFVIPGSSLDLRIDDVPALVKQIRRGLHFNKLTLFQRTSLLPLESITRVMQLPRRTLARRKQSRILSPEESERLVRLAQVFEKATNLFEGEKSAARAWLNSPCKALGNVAPLVAAETELGARAVEDVIGQLEHGVFV